MKFNKLTIALSCLLAVPAIFAAGDDKSNFSKAKDFVVNKFNSGKSTVTTFVNGHKKTSIAGGLGAAVLLGGAVYYKYSDQINPKVKAAAQEVKKAAIAAKNKFAGLSTKAKLGAIAGALSAVAVPVLLYVAGNKYLSKIKCSA